MHQRGLAGITAPMLPYVLCLLCNTQSIVSFTVTVRDETTILVLLEPADLGPDNAMYAVKVTGEAQTQIVHFQNVTDTLPPPLVFNASYHGLCYTFSLLVSGSTWSKPVKTITVLTKPLPVNRVFIYDYKPSPQTGVIFEIVSPENNVFSRVNISYLEAGEPRSLLYKDFSMGKTVFNHWLPGICYSNITFRLVSEASFNKSSLVQQSDVQHEPQRHRTVPNIPLNVSVKLVRPGDSGVDPSIWRFRKTRDVSLLDEQEEVELHGGDDVTQTLNTEQDQITPTQISTSSPGSPQLNSLEGENNTQPYFQVSSGSPLPTEEFVNEDRGSAMDLSWPLLPTYLPTKLPLILLELHWQPPRAPTVYDGFSVYIYRDGNPLVTIVDESTLEFFTELNDPGTYKALVATRSTSGDCEARESLTGAGYTFYLTPSGQSYEEPQERPKGVEVRQLGPSSAAVSWAPSFENHNGSLVSVISLTCSKPIPSQRMESSYCTEENITSDVITNLTPGAQYRIVVHHTNGPLLSPPSDPFILRTSPTGIRDLTVFPLSPSAVILSWRRPYQVAFRKYILETFFFNPVTLTSQWSTYYEIAATGAVIGSVRMPDLLPAWFYTVRVTMETWGEPALRCCDGSTVSFITAPEAPHISTVDYTGSTLYMRWTYGDIFTDLTHSRLLHWQVVAEGRKGSRKRISTNVTRTIMKAMLSLPPGDIYNLTVTACTERSRNTSIPHIIRLDPAPPKSLYAVNTTQTSVSLLWVEEGVVDYYQVSCRPLVPNKDLKVMEPQTVHSHVTTVFNLQSATIYNCSVTSYSYSSPSEPVHISISTSGKEANPSVAAISVLAVLSVLLISLLVFILIVLRKKHLQMARECGAGTFINFASFERDGKLPYNWRRSLFAFLTLLPSCLWTDFLAFYINPWSKTALKKRKLTCPVQLDDFDSYVKDMSKDSAYKFSLQFEELKSVGLDLPHEAADLPANRVKNRYTNILPYDFSRVKLISIQSDEGSDYINANYIPGYRSPLEYIATQGPLPETRNDFWKMVLQQKSHVVVMLTQCSERRRVKCDHYWPFTDEPTAYGEIMVEMRSEKESPEWTMRNFRLSYLDETQDVLHLNYTSWPDHGVPTVNAIESILQFVQIVRQHSAKSKGPIIVHCSAGVGRTGTFIALDRLMQHMREHEFVDILGLVSEMRSHRLCMVQTEEQYVFIHQCVQLMWRKKKQQSTTNDVVYENVAKS